MDTTYFGEHSIIFGSKHTWNDWGLVPSERPSVVMPSVNTYFVDIPGANGRLDLSEVLTGFPTYKNRSGSWKFNIAQDQIEYTWDRLYEAIANYLHGRKRQCILTDDPAYFYNGRYTVDSFSSGKNFSTLSIKYDLDPFKWLTWTTCGDWLWDPFDFVYGEITKSDFANLTVAAGSQNLKTWTQAQIGMAPVTPTITVNSSDGTSGMTIAIDNVGTGQGVKTFTLQNGENYNPQIMLSCPDTDSVTRMVVYGEGTISIDFRPGRL